MDKIKLTAILIITAIIGITSPGYGANPGSVQLVGDFNGITCYPEDTENDMTNLGGDEWVKLQFIDEPGAPPDTIDFKFTMNGDYFPEHWGWSHLHGWGTAALGYSPPMIAAALPDSGYYYFHFNSSTYAYSLERPQSRIYGDLTSDVNVGPITDGAVTLYDSLGQVLGKHTPFTDYGYSFDNLPPATYSLYAEAPYYTDTLITGIELPQSDSIQIDIELRKATATMITSTGCERSDGQVVLNWSASTDPGFAGFDIYRGPGPEYSNMVKRNYYPITGSNGEYHFIDRGIESSEDYYYYIVESNDPGGLRYGPVISSGGASHPGRLGANYPNPFNPSTTIPFTVGSGSNVSIAFYDASGRMVSSADLGYRHAGDYTYTWNPSAAAEDNLPSGVYYCRLSIGKNRFTRKLVLLR
ncbi:MAG: T9SS type A sorting domain-containing protein [Candidatus Latescibacteria bacterium]|nr:T9SS type A sorting domain-containing protein [bacterium]MBD3423907.1 T9SS type A sorting domain-containing protein [Candidatus Latescibacterota bacterium]